jgi:hypothetical protein
VIRCSSSGGGRRGWKLPALTAAASVGTGTTVRNVGGGGRGRVKGEVIDKVVGGVENGSSNSPFGVSTSTSDPDSDSL